MVSSEIPDIYIESRRSKNTRRDVLQGIANTSCIHHSHFEYLYTRLMD